MVDLLLVGGVLALLMFQTVARPDAPPGGEREVKAETSDTISLIGLRRVEERGLVIDGSADFTPDTRSAIDPEGRATTPRVILDDSRDELRRDPAATPALHIVWTAMAVALGEDRLAVEAIGELARDPDTLAAHGSRLDDLHRLARQRPADDLDALTRWLGDRGASDWLVQRLRGRHLALAGDSEGAEAATSAAQRLASGFVRARLTMIGLQFGLLLIGLITLVVFPLLLRRRRLRAAPQPARSPFRTERTRRVLIGWILFTWSAQFLLGRLIGALEVSGTTLAAMQTVATAINALTAVILIYLWGSPPAEDGQPRWRTLWRRLGLHLPESGLRGILLWAIPGVGVAVVALQLSALVSSLILGPPEQFQESILLLMSSDDPMNMLWIGIGAVVIAPVAEEMLFRGFIYRNFKDTLGRPVALILSGAIFGLVHMHPAYFLPLTGLGIALAVLYDWSGSLWVPIIAHAAWNGITLAQVHLTFHL